LPKKITDFAVQDPFVMNENTVNKLVADYLTNSGFQDVKFLLNKQRGIDVYGRNNDLEVYVESKGSHGNDHGKDKVFDNNQLWDHLCKQIGKIMEYRTSFHFEKSIFVAANPNIPRIKKQMKKITSSLDELNIYRFWVNHDGSIVVEGPQTDKLFRI
jgi:hypothetical protein